MATDLEQLWEEAAEGLSGLEEFVGTITEAYFQTSDEAFGSAGRWGNNAILTLKFKIDQPIDPPDFKFDETTISLSVGKAENWQILDGGERIQSLKGGMGNSKYQRWINAIVKDLKIPLAATRKLTPFDAKVWLGLKLHVKRETRILTESEKARLQGGSDTVKSWVPVAWLQSEVPPLA